jgi:hypothetical protein
VAELEAVCDGAAKGQWPLGAERVSGTVPFVRALHSDSQWIYRADNVQTKNGLRMGSRANTDRSASTTVVLT